MKMKPEMDGKMMFGDKLKRFRTAQGLSQEELAKKLGTTKQIISRYETHQRIPKVTVAQDYAHKLDVPVSYFFDEENSQTYRVAETPQRPYTANNAVLKQLLEETEDLSKEEFKLLVELIKTMKAKK